MSHRKALIAIIQNAELNRFNSNEHHIVMNPIDVALLSEEVFEHYHPNHKGGKLTTFMGWEIKSNEYCPIGTIRTDYSVNSTASPYLTTSISKWH